MLKIKTGKNRNKKWIINSLLDLDYYKLTMAQIAFYFFPFIPVVFGFTNRTKKVQIANFVKIKDLRAELDHVRTLRLNDKEAKYLQERPGIKQKFVNFLRNLQLPEYKLEEVDGQYFIEFSGNWPEVTLWETFCLSILNELYYRALLKRMARSERRKVYVEGKKRLEKKIAILIKNPQLIFTEFGTRRRFSEDWQRYVVKRLAESLPATQFLGTSNVKLAMDLNLTPIGTFAHEMYMIFSGIFHKEEDGILKSHNRVLKYWWDMYGGAGQQRST